MIRFKSMRMITQQTDGIIYPIQPNKPFMIVYFSENSNLMDDYPKLNIRRMDARVVVVPITKIPRVILTNDISRVYKKMGLL